MARNLSAVPPAPQPSLSPARSRVLRALADADEPLTLAMLSARTGSHPNTLREHLAALETAGLVAGETLPSAGGRRGRPARGYRATTPPPGVDATSLATALALEVDGLADASGLALRAGERWGEALGEAGAGSDLLAHLARLGFAPLEVEEGIVLRACPVAQAAVAAPGVVCRMHLGALRHLLPDAAILDLVTDGHAEGCLLRLRKPV